MHICDMSIPHVYTAVRVNFNALYRVHYYWIGLLSIGVSLIDYV